jgi:hypothetical protein
LIGDESSIGIKKKFAAFEINTVARCGGGSKLHPYILSPTMKTA